MIVTSCQTPSGIKKPTTKTPATKLTMLTIINAHIDLHIILFFIWGKGTKKTAIYFINKVNSYIFAELKDLYYEEDTYTYNFS